MSVVCSRRGLVEGAAATAVVGAIGSICAPVAKADDSKEMTPSTFSWMIAPEPISDDQIAETLNCEILILGAGSGGVPASLYAALQDADVIVMTKGYDIEPIGWSTAGYNTRYDAEYGIHYDPVAYRAEYASASNGKGNIAMYGQMMDRSGEAMDYIADLVADEMPFRIDPYEVLAGEDGPATHMVYYWLHNDDLATRYAAFSDGLHLLQSKAEAAGARYIFNTPAQQLVMDDSGACKGAIGLNENGDYIKVTASKGVLITTGNIISNPEMLSYFVPQLAGNPSVSPYKSATGDGHRMAMWVGAKMDQPPLCIGAASTDGASVGNIDQPGIYYGRPWLRVNANGARFTNETLGGESQLAAWADTIQPGKVVYQICDANYAPVARDAETFERFVENGQIATAETLEGLAELVGIDPQGLVASVERYNEICASGIDVDFGVPSETLELVGGIHEAPYYAIRQTPAIGFTIGGIRTNKDLQVVDENEQVIPGLWVAGNALGGQWGYLFPFRWFGATNKMGAFVGGMLAIKSILGTLDQPF